MHSTRVMDAMVVSHAHTQGMAQSEYDYIGGLDGPLLHVFMPEHAVKSEPHQ